jgi:hypothetical protein
MHRLINARDVALKSSSSGVTGIQELQNGERTPAPVTEGDEDAVRVSFFVGCPFTFDKARR